MRIRIKATSDLGNVAYVYGQTETGVWHCALKDGINAAFSYAGLRDEMECRFNLEDCKTPENALAVCQRFGYPKMKFEICRTGGTTK